MDSKVHTFKRSTHILAALVLAAAFVVSGGYWNPGQALADAPPTITLPFPPDSHMAIVQGWVYNYNSGTPVCENNPWMHCGIDYVYQDGSSQWLTFPVLADAPGTAYHVDGGDCGNGIQINSSGGLETLYCHLSGDSFRIGHGVSVNRGDLVGWAGSSGSRNPPLHLHMQIKINGALTDPYGIWNTADHYPNPNSDSSPLKYYNQGFCDGGEGVYLYQHANFNGRCQKFTQSSPDWVNWYVGNDEVSSVRFVGSWTATLYSNSSYMGTSSTFTQDQYNLSHDTGVGNDTTSSIRVEHRGGGGGGGGRWTIRLYNVDDFAAAAVNGSQVLSANYRQDTGWVDITSNMRGGDNGLQFGLYNQSGGYTWGFSVAYDGNVVWTSEAGQCGVWGANNDDQSRDGQWVQVENLVLHPQGTVTVR